MFRQIKIIVRRVLLTTTVATLLAQVRGAVAAAARVWAGGTAGVGCGRPAGPATGRDGRGRDPANAGSRHEQARHRHPEGEAEDDDARPDRGELEAFRGRPQLLAGVGALRGVPD